MADWKDYSKSMRDAKPSELAVARYLETRGFTVIPDDTPISDDPELAWQGDGGDLRVINPQGREFIVEVKRWPKRLWGNMKWCHLGLCIDKVSSFNNKDPRPDAYYLLDKEMEVAWVFDVNAKWEYVYIDSLRDSIDFKLKPCYMADVKHFKPVRIK